MKRKRWYIVIAAVILSCAGAAAAQTFARTDAVETKSSGKINWTVGEVYAKGIGSPPARAMNSAQARAMATRAAQVVAYRNLLETVKGVRIDSETLVEKYIVKSDVIRIRVEGIVKGARIVKKRHLSDGSVEVLVAMPMKGAFMNAIVPDDFGSSTVTPLPIKPAPISPAIPEPKPAPSRPEPSKPMPSNRPEPPKPAPVPPPPPSSPSSTVFSGGIATGVVIDGRGLGLKPALLPRIVDPQGSEIYVGQVVTRTNAVEQGVAGYAKDVKAAANNFRVTDNPVVMKGTRAVGNARTDIMLAQADAEKLRNLSGKGDFLQYCRVIIVY